MASKEIVKTLSIKVSGEDSVKSIKQRIKDLQDALLNVEKGSEDWKKITEQLVDDQSRLNDVLKAGKTQMDVAADSIVGMERQYKALYDTYKLLTEEQRNSDFGKEMAKSLSDLHDKLNETKMEVGNFKDNIGNYSASVMDAFSKMGISVGALEKPMKLASNGTKELGKSFKALIANPVGATIMAIVIAFKALTGIANKVKEAIQGNEETSMKLKEAMAAFQPIIDGVKNTFDAIAKVTVKVISGFASLTSAIRGITKHGREVNAIYKEIAQSQNELVKTTREYEKLNAEDSAVVEELRERASETDNLEEKERLLTEAKEKQAEIDERNITLAEENLRILKEESELTANDAEANDKLAAAEAAVSKARADAAKNARQYNKEMNSISKTRANSAKEAQKEVQKLLDTIKEESQTEIEKLTDKYNKEKALLEKYHKDTTQLEKNYQKNLSKIKAEEIGLTRASEEAYRMALIASKGLPQALYDVIDNTKIKITDFSNSMVKAFGIFGGDTGNDYKALIDSLVEGADAISHVDKGVWEMFSKETGMSVNNVYDLKTALLGLKQELIDGEDELDFYEKNLMALSDSVNTILERPGVKVDGDKAMSAIFGFDVNSVNNLISNALSAYEKGLGKIDEVRKKAYEKLNEPLNDSTWIVGTGTGYIQQLDNVADALFAFYEAQETFRRNDLLNHALYLKNELDNFKGNEVERLNLLTEYREAMSDIDDYYLQAKLNKIEIERDSIAELQDAYFNLSKSATDSLGSIIDSITSMTNATISATQSQIQEGKLSEKDIEKRKKSLKALEGVQLAVALAGIAADTASGIMGVWRGYGMEQAVNAQTAAATGPAAAATFAALQAKSLTMAGINTGIIAAAGSANLAAAIAGSVSNFKAINQLGSEGSATAAGSSPSIIDATPYSYSRELQTNAEREEEINKPLWVSVVDINNAQNKVSVTEKERTF